MNAFMNQNQVDELARQRALDRLTGEERLRMEAEQAEAEAREREARAEIFRQSDAAEAEAVNQMAQLASKYAARRAAAEKALAAIAEFYAVESELKSALVEIDARLYAHWQRTVSPVMRPQRWAGLRESAGLAPYHRLIGLAIPEGAAAILGATAIQAIVSESLRPGLITVGSNKASYDFSQGV